MCGRGSGLLISVSLSCLLAKKLMAASSHSVGDVCMTAVAESTEAEAR